MVTRAADSYERTGNPPYLAKNTYILTVSCDTRTPIISAPMASGGGGELAGAVTGAGGFGFIGAAFLSYADLKANLSIVRKTLNLPDGAPLPVGIGFVSRVLAKTENSDDPRLPAILEEKPQAIWFAFGDDLGKYVAQVREYDSKREHKTIVFIMVNSVEEALRAANEWKVDVIVAQGIEAGGHGGSEAPSLLTLLQAVINAIPPDGPVIVAAGGISTGSQIAASLTIGAAGVVLGTRFLFTHECIYSQDKKDAIIQAGLINSTRRTLAFDEVRRTMGWPDKINGRALANDIVRDLDEGLGLEARLKRFDESAASGDTSRLIVWAGEGVGLTDHISSASSFEEIVAAKARMVMPHLSLVVLAITLGTEAHASSQPVVNLPYGSFLGTTDNNVTQFLGIPFAQPPRQYPFKVYEMQIRTVPHVLNKSKHIPRDLVSRLPMQIHQKIVKISTSLTINIIKPAKHGGTRHPVLFLRSRVDVEQLHQGGFEIGDATDTPMLPFVQRSIVIDQPVVAVTANHRLNGFGFLAGEQVEREGLGNLGLHDQRFALQWVQKHIHKFGGDPDKVVVAGPSAGAISIGMHLTADDGKTAKNLFRGAFMESGSLIPMESMASGQDAFDQIARFSNCSDIPDPLQCLREIPYDTLVTAINQTRNLFAYTSLNNDWKPRVDGRTWKQDALCSVNQGFYAKFAYSSPSYELKIPFIAGNCDDEGTTNAEFLQYIRAQYLQRATDDEISEVENAYPEDPTFGSPFDTGTNNTLSPEYKRMAAVQGDLVFQGPRRVLLHHASQTQNTWAYLNKRGKTNPIVGASHASDKRFWYGINTTDFRVTDHLINFINHLNPNGKSENTNSSYWPTWHASKAQPSLLTFYDNTSIQLSPDTFRSDSMTLLTDLEVDVAQRRGLCHNHLRG
ncbi:hypothetical protein D9758_011254 [Tetrapyrgos nigripes]|uniref:Carboxylesterase type B domain-containing protein n=1 Tax=Tetrapyrgos nigripes TaxID=182062 RepID=A0A8H5FSD3_9AGAR|nr:hypothetical protein D9758_011254 [Tetrapyrgos nigripes]